MAKSTKKNGIFKNPFMKKLSKITETSDVNTTYLGVILKCAYFFGFIFLGLVLAIILHITPSNAVSDDFSINKVELVVACISLLIIFICPILCSFLRKTIPVLGAISCVGIGYFIAFIGNFIPEYKPLILLALLLTCALIVAMLIVFSCRLVKSNSKFFSFLYSVLIALVISSLILFICSFIPVLNTIPAFVFNTPWLYIAISVIYIMLGCGFLLSDFESLRDAVNNQSSKSIEWLLSYAIIFDVVWIFFEILDLLTYIKSND